jgi:hypothetical protein
MVFGPIKELVSPIDKGRKQWPTDGIRVCGRYLGYERVSIKFDIRPRLGFGPIYRRTFGMLGVPACMRCLLKDNDRAAHVRCSASGSQACTTASDYHNIRLVVPCLWGSDGQDVCSRFRLWTRCQRRDTIQFFKFRQHHTLLWKK